MTAGNPREHSRRAPAAGEVPTGAAELSISIVPAAARPAGPPVVASAGADVRGRRAVIMGVSWFSSGRDRGPSVRHRIRAAIEAEVATVPEASAATIEAELARIMSPRPGREAGREPSRELPGLRRWSRAHPVSQLWGNSGDYEPTAAADLRIRLMPL